MGRKKIENYDNLMPPYLSFDHFQESINYFKNITLIENDRIIFDVFTHFSDSIKQRLCLAYKFFNFITPTEDATKDFITFLYSDSSEERKTIIKKGYRKFFDECPNYANLSKKELKDKFISVYGLNANSANSSISFFYPMLKYYGIFVSNDDVVAKNTSQTKLNDIFKYVILSQSLTEEQIKMLTDAGVDSENFSCTYRIDGDKIHFLFTH
jgi:hypothetical protein